jgi:hypothetical protein
MFFRRGLGDTPDPWLNAKLWTFSIAAILALLGMTLALDWLIGAAGILLAGGLLLRFLPADRHGDQDHPDDPNGSDRQEGPGPGAPPPD